MLGVLMKHMRQGQHGDMRQGSMGTSHLNPRLSWIFSLTLPATSATASLALQSQYSVQAKGLKGGGRFQP